ncbi:MAG: type II toxin-antitoxin system PemK/MazF family toxin [Actinobacteria bacterium]|nr:type II toxin-antitoxin system PemK/MazF family toxin [Actinomycetota bacterium]
MNRGEVWWVEDPDAGRRPHLILTRQSAIPRLHSVLSVPATRTVRGIPTEVALSRQEGMPEDCVLTLDNLTLIPRSFFVERICRLRAGRMRDVCAALFVATGCA